MSKTSIKALVRDAKLEDKRERADIQTAGKAKLSGVAADSFINLAHKMGIGADNPLTYGTYGYNPITRNRNLLEWIHRGSWLGGVAVDIVADDMTRAGVDFKTELKPEDQEKIDHEVTNLDIWGKISEVVRWGRLYGGCLGILLIDGQNPNTPLRMETVGPDKFKGLLVVDRWMCEPSLEDLVTEYGPHLGTPKYYRIQYNAPALKGQSVHYSRVAFREVGIELPLQQRLTENLWGISVLERLYDRMIAYDSASTGAAQLVYKAYLRTLTVDGLRDIAAGPPAAMNGLVAYTDIMRRFQSLEGLTLIDGKDKLEIQGHQAFSGLSDVLTQFGQQLSGALQIPLTRLFGQSPAGLNATGESDLRTYYDNIHNRQKRSMYVGTSTVYKLVAKSMSIKLDDKFAIDFSSLWQMDETQKADVADKNTKTVSGAFTDGLVGRQTALRELRQASRLTGVFTNITQEMIDAADDEVGPPEMPGLTDPLTGLPVPQPKDPHTGLPMNLAPGEKGPAPVKEDNSLPGDTNAIRPDGKAKPVASSKARRKLV